MDLWASELYLQNAILCRRRQALRGLVSESAARDDDRVLDHGRDQQNVLRRRHLQSVTSVGDLFFVQRSADARTLVTLGMTAFVVAFARHDGLAVLLGHSTCSFEVDAK